MLAQFGKASQLSEAHLSVPAITVSNNRQTSVLKRDRYWCVDGEAGFFQPETFQKNERRHAIPAGVRFGIESQWPFRTFRVRLFMVMLLLCNF